MLEACTQKYTQPQDTNRKDTTAPLLPNTSTTTVPSSPTKKGKTSEQQFLFSGVAKGFHPIHDKKLSTDILAGATRKKDDWACEIFGFTPASCRDPFGNLAKADGVFEKFLVPNGSRREVSRGWMVANVGKKNNERYQRRGL